MATVLLIEDDAESRRATGELFLRKGWNVLEAGDGEVGVEVALKHRPDLILCDLLMPKANGFQVCRSIRQQLQPAKIIIVSGRDYGVDRTSAIEAGADEYLVKPIRLGKSARSDRARPARQRTRRGQDRPRPRFHAAFDTLEILGRARLDSRARIVHRRATAATPVASKCAPTAKSSSSMPAPGCACSGIALEEEFGAQPIRLTLLISHTHWDHIQGTAFFPSGLQRKELPARARLRRRAQRAGDRSWPVKWRPRFSPSACATCRARSRSRN